MPFLSNNVSKFDSLTAKKFNLNLVVWLKGFNFFFVIFAYDIIKNQGGAYFDC